MKQLKFRALAMVLALVLLGGNALALSETASYDDLTMETKGDVARYSLLAELGIMQGYGDGSFGAEVELSRAEMAKMLYVVATGGSTDAVAFAVLETPFTDISGHWAENYIKYGYQNGFFSGVSPTEFAPNGKLTVMQCAKMLLSTLGYEMADGAGWDAYVIALLQETGALEQLGNSSLLGADSCVRSVAARMVYAALHDTLADATQQLISRSFGLTCVTGRILATDELALQGEKAAEGSFILEPATNAEGDAARAAKALEAPDFELDYTWLGRAVMVYSDKKGAAKYIYESGEGTQLMTGKTGVTVDGQTVTITNPEGERYEHRFTDEQWNESIPFIHSFGAAEQVKISDLFAGKKHYMVGANSDRVIIGYDAQGMLYYAMSFTNTLDKVSKVDLEGNRAQIRNKWYDIGDLDGAEEGDMVIYSISGIDGKIYMVRLETATLTGLRYDSGAKTVYADGGDGEEVQVVFATNVTDPGGKLVAQSGYRSFASVGEREVYTLQGIVYCRA